MTRLLRIIRLAIGAAPLLLCKVGLHRWERWAPEMFVSEELLDDPIAFPAAVDHLKRTRRCTRCLRWKG